MTPEHLTTSAVPGERFTVGHLGWGWGLRSLRVKQLSFPGVTVLPLCRGTTLFMAMCQIRYIYFFNHLFRPSYVPGTVLWVLHTEMVPAFKALVEKTHVKGAGATPT